VKQHDYTIREYGHNYFINKVFDQGQRITAVGWGEGIKQWDYMVVQLDATRTTRYQFESIHYYHDPPDMWKATLKFAPRDETDE
jgi:hypothetical protein